MNFQLVGKSIIKVLSVVLVASTLFSCGLFKSKEGGGKTLSSKKGNSSKGGLLSFKKGIKETVGVENGEIVASARRGGASQHLMAWF